MSWFDLIGIYAETLYYTAPWMLTSFEGPSFFKVVWERQKYEKLMYKAERLEQKSLKSNSDKKRWKLQDKADYYKTLAYSLNLEELSK